MVGHGISMGSEKPADSLYEFCNGLWATPNTVYITCYTYWTVSNEPSELSQWLCHDDSTINIVWVLLLLLFLFLCQPCSTKPVGVNIKKVLTAATATHSVDIVFWKATAILSVNWRHIGLIDLVSAKGKTKVSWLISFHSLIRQCFNILIRHCNPSRIRNIKIERSKQLHHNNTLPLISSLPKLGQWCDVSWPRE